MASETIAVDVQFMVFLLFGGGTLILILQKKNRIAAAVPYTVAMFLYGLVIGLLRPFLLQDATTTLANLPPQLVFHIFLPVLIFEGSYGMKIHALDVVRVHAVLLAGPGLIINTGILAVVTHLMFPSWSWYAAVLIGSLLSATDPVAVVSLLKGLGVDKRITALVDGEAIMNDGTAVIMYSIFLPAALSGTWDMPVAEVLKACVRYTVVAGLLGTLSGIFLLVSIRQAKIPLVQACLTVAVTYSTYYVADVLVETSPILTMFFQGTFLSRYYPSLFPGNPTRESVIMHTWEFLVLVGNTLLFSLVGMILLDVEFHAIDILHILVMYGAMTVGRGIMIAVLLPVMNLMPYKLRWQDVLMLTHGGLRGGVATVLALGLYQLDEFSQGDTVLKLTVGVVGLTLLINATTAERVVTKLGLKKKPRHRVNQMQLAVATLKSEGMRELSNCRDDAALQNADWGVLTEFVSKLEDPYSGAAIKDEPEEVQANILMMNAFKSAIWMMRDNEDITENVVRKLTEMCSSAMRDGSLLTTAKLLQRHGQLPLWVTKLESGLTGCLQFLSSNLERYRLIHDHDVLMMVLACTDALDVVELAKSLYLTTEESMVRISRWIHKERRALQDELERIGHVSPHLRRNLATAHVGRRALATMHRALSSLRVSRGLSCSLTFALEEALHELKHEIDELSTTNVSEAATDSSVPASPQGMISSQPDAATAALKALHASFLCDKLTEDAARRVLARSTTLALRQGEAWRRPPAGWESFFVVVSGVIAGGQHERGPTAVVHPSFILEPDLASKLHGGGSGSGMMRHVFFAEEFRAQSEVKMLVFQFSDFVTRTQQSAVATASVAEASSAREAPPAERFSAAPLQPATSLPSITTGLYRMVPEVQEGFWKSVANEALTPFLSSVRSISPFDIATRGTVMMIVDATQQVVTSSSPQSTDTFLIHGGDEAGLYHVHGSPVPIPRLMLPRTTWKVGSVLFHVELPQWNHGNPTMFASATVTQQHNPSDGNTDNSNNDNHNDEVELREISRVLSVDVDLQPSPSRTVILPRDDHGLEEWLETVLLADYLIQHSECNQSTLITAYNTAVNNAHLNRLHASLLWACESVVIEAFNYERRLGSDTQLIQALRRSIAQLISLAVDYCSRAQIVMGTDRKPPLTLVAPGSLLLLRQQRQLAHQYHHLEDSDGLRFTATGTLHDDPVLHHTESFSPSDLSRTNSSGFAEFAMEFRGADAVITLDKTAIVQLITELRVDACSWSMPMFATPESPEFALAISRRVTKYLVDFAHATVPVATTTTSRETAVSLQQQQQQ